MNWIAFFQHTDWGFWSVVVTLIAVIATIIIPLIIFVLSKKRKSLSYEIITDTKLFSVHEEAKQRFEILFDDKPIEDVSILILKIINDGNTPIKSEDFEVPLSIVLGEKVEILSAEIVNTSEYSLKPVISHSINKISIEPSLLNAKDNFQIKSLLLNYENLFTIDARIVGVKNIEELKDKTFKLFIVYTISISILFASVLFILKKFYLLDSELIPIGAMFVMLGLSAFVFYHLDWKFKL